VASHTAGHRRATARAQRPTGRGGRLRGEDEPQPPAHGAAFPGRDQAAPRPFERPVRRAIRDDEADAAREHAAEEIESA
jgi:hypothetical protein